MNRQKNRISCLNHLLYYKSYLFPVLQNLKNMSYSTKTDFWENTSNNYEDVRKLR